MHSPEHDEEDLAPTSATGRLYLVATPIGNLEDISLRAIRVLRESERVLAEDTRHTSKLFRHHGIGTPLQSLHAHSSKERLLEVSEELANGARMSLVSDAGTPLVSDPGAELVRLARARGVKIEPIPGASAPISALIASGLSHPQFQFVGFLPRGGKRRRTALERIARYPGATTLFEAANRLGETLVDLRNTLGGTRRVAVCRELTKLHEEIVEDELDALIVRYSQSPLGEITLVISVPEHLEELDEAERIEVSDAEIRSWLEAGMSVRDTADRLAETEGVPRKDAYRRVLSLA